GGTERTVAGILQELIDKGVSGGWCRDEVSHAVFNVERLKTALDELVADAGVEVLFHTFAADALKRDNIVEGIVAATKEGLWAFRAGVVVDCTGDGDVAVFAGADYQIGRPLDGLCQPATTMVLVGGLDMERIYQYMRQDPRMRRLLAAAIEAGEMEPFETVMHGFVADPALPGYAYVNDTAIRRVRCTDPRDMTRAEIEGRRQAWQLVEVLRKHLPGAEAAQLIATAATVGVRETRRIIGDYMLDVHDVLNCRQFEDGIARNAFIIDVHDPEKGDNWNIRHLPKGGWHHIPYRCLLPRGLENILVAGRCVSATHEALASIRVMAQCMAMGQAAGTAAALAATTRITPRQLDVGRLRRTLESQGAIV
ncbi:MAG: FAD-dependent oxidoreductase, partial [Armatimonadetes bacterium]|nr:FAD-dependent oxidoreductase [Armatimonadota bacterium]